MYPDEFLRGIPNEQFIDDDYYPTSDLFYFHIRENIPQRKDDYIEESINWKDDDGAFENIFDQKKDNGEIQFKAGAAVLCRIELDRVIKRPAVNNYLSYERSEKPDNKYHGNLLLRKNLTKKVIQKIAATIATYCVKSIVKNSNIE